MRTAVWIQIFLASVLWNLCTPALGGINYIVAMKTPTPKNAFHYLQTTALLDQPWTQLLLIPLKEQKPKLSATLTKIFPGTSFAHRSSSQEHQYLIAQSTDGSTYLAWFITGETPDSSPNTIPTLYRRILPIAPYVISQSKAKISTTPDAKPEETLLTLESPGVLFFIQRGHFSRRAGA